MQHYCLDSVYFLTTKSGSCCYDHFYVRNLNTQKCYNIEFNRKKTNNNNNKKLQISKSGQA